MAEKVLKNQTGSHLDLEDSRVSSEREEKTEENSNSSYRQSSQRQGEKRGSNLGTHEWSEDMGETRWTWNLGISRLQGMSAKNTEDKLERYIRVRGD